MDKISNCPNNSFDCGVACGLHIATQAGLKVIEKIKTDEKRIEIMKLFLLEMNKDISEKHLEHMDNRYKWERVIDKILK